MRYDFFSLHISSTMQTSLSIRGLGALSALGENLTDHYQAILEGVFPFRPIGELMDHSNPLLPAAWIQHRGLLTHRKWSPASMAALHVARQAIAQAGWSRAELAEAVLILGTSRGGAAGWRCNGASNRDAQRGAHTRRLRARITWRERRPCAA